jgi:DNA (cytosine-5)-methyltransferase 1
MGAALRKGSLCTGYGGLDQAIGQHIPGDLGWVADNDADASMVIAVRFPGVPNLGDITRIDWASPPDAELWSGGYPCQPFSQAGRRRGTSDERHIWPYIAEGIRVRRPPLVILENVAGHLTLGFDQVLRDLATAGYDAYWVVVTAAAAGAPHKRARLFIIAVRADLGTCTPSGQPIAVCRDGAWWAAADGMFGPVQFKGRIPAAGSMNDSRIYARNWPVPPAGQTSGLLPTPAAGSFNDGEDPELWLARRQRLRDLGVNGNGMGTPLGMAVQLLKTPTAQLGVNGGSQHPDKRKAGGHGPTLADEIEHLLPTPRCADGLNEAMDVTAQRLAGGARCRGTIEEAVALLPTPNATDGQGGIRAVPESRTSRGKDHGPRLRDVAPALLPTPNATDWKGSGQARGRDRDGRPRTAGDADLPEAVAPLPTPSAANAHGNDVNNRGEMLLPGVVQVLATAHDDRVHPWGKYAPAIDRWAAILGRPAPAPTYQAKDGKHRLAPEAVEFMMGLPAGWVTAVPHLTRTGKPLTKPRMLKILGNGVVPQQGDLGLAIILGAVPAAVWDRLAEIGRVAA